MKSTNSQITTQKYGELTYLQIKGYNILCINIEKYQIKNSLIIWSILIFTYILFWFLQKDFYSEYHVTIALRLANFTYLMLALLWITNNGLESTKEFDSNNPNTTKQVLCNRCRYFHESDDKFWYCGSCRNCYRSRYLHCGFAGKCITIYNMFFYLAGISAALILSSTYIAYYYLSVISDYLFGLTAESVLVQIAKKVLFFINFDGQSQNEIIFTIAATAMTQNIVFSIFVGFMAVKLGYVAMPEYFRKRKVV